MTLKSQYFFFHFVAFTGQHFAVTSLTSLLLCGGVKLFATALLYSITFNSTSLTTRAGLLPTRIRRKRYNIIISATVITRILLVREKLQGTYTTYS